MSKESQKKKTKSKNKFNPDDLAFYIMKWQARREKPAKSIKKALALFENIDGSYIVEIGSTRSEYKEEELNTSNDGYSSVHFAKTGKEFVTCDIDKGAAQLTYDLLEELELLENATVINGDGLKFLEKYEFKNKIDLLYLDAWDVDTPSSNFATNHLKAYEIALPNLNEKHIILIDDTDLDVSPTRGLYIDKDAKGGKGKLLIPHLEEKGYKVRFKGRQTCLTNF